MRRTTFALAFAVALAMGAGALALVIASDHEQHKFASAALALTAGLSFVAAGLFALRRRPENRTGAYLAAVGYLWFLGALSESNNDWVFTAGALVSNLVFIPFAALVLAFPTGKLTTRADQLVLRGTIAFTVLAQLIDGLVNSSPQPDCKDPRCPTSAIVVYDSHRLAQVVEAVFTTMGLGLLAIVVVLLILRWRRASRALRRVLAPVYLAGGGTLFVLLLLNVIAEISQGVADDLDPAFLVLFATIPFAFLLGVLRSRLAQGSVGRLVLSIGQGMPLRDSIAGALGDPSLELAYRLEESGRYVDRDGRPFELPGAGSGRSATIVQRDSQPVGALVYDQSLDDERELVESVAAAVALALDNERLQTDIRAQYELLTTIVDTAPSLLVTVDTEGRILNLNPATLRASGYDDHEAVRGRFFWDVFIDNEEREAMVARFQLAAPEFAASEYENAFTNARGEEIVIAWRSAPLPDETGQVTRIIAGGLDITERKRQELELQWNVDQRKLQEEEVRASRTRIVAAEDEARRRLERNLHDGAQQRLVSLSLALRLAQAKVATDPAATAEVLEGAREELAHALEELRELARGIHPAILTDRGLNAALESLAGRAPLPVAVTTLAERLPEAVEAAAYYVVSEAITNVVKHGRASAVEVHLSAPNGSLVIEVADDGVGGADPADGSGLRGLADRVAVLDGRFRIESPRGGGTRIVAEIPVPAPWRASPLRVVLADDSVLLREGIARLLEEAGFEVVGQADTAEQLLLKVRSYSPDVAIVDIRMPPTHTDEGLRAAREIRERHPQTGVLVLSQYLEAEYAFELLAESAEGVGYLLKDRVSDIAEFAAAVRRVGDGGSALDPTVVAQLVGRRRKDDPLASLTPRERDVLELMAEGRSNQAICDRLFVTERAVEKHVTSIFAKLRLPADAADHRRVLAVLTYLRP